MGGLKKDESILIHNAGGGVGLAALDIAKHIGAKTFGTASAGKHEFLYKRGLDHAIDYRNQDWLPVLMSLTGGRGVELVIDPLGGPSWKKSYRALRATGRMGVFGMSVVSASGIRGKLRAFKAIAQMPRFSPLGLMNRNKGCVRFEPRSHVARRRKGARLDAGDHARRRRRLDSPARRSSFSFRSNRGSPSTPGTAQEHRQSCARALAFT